MKHKLRSMKHKYVIRRTGDSPRTTFTQVDCFENPRLSSIATKSPTNGACKSGAGFIALISAIIISAVLLVVTVTLSYSSFFARYNLLDSEYKDRSSALAEGCVDAALLKLANDPNYYANNERTLIGSDECHIKQICLPSSNCSKAPLSGQQIIETYANFQNACTNLSVAINQNTLAVQSWEEVPYFVTSGACGG